jgi:hypothetical protein
MHQAQGYIISDFVNTYSSHQVNTKIYTAIKNTDELETCFIFYPKHRTYLMA